MIFFSSSRHRFVIFPALCLWAGFAIDKFFHISKNQRIIPIIIFLSLFILSLIGVPDERRNYDPFLLFNQSRTFLSLGDIDSAEKSIDNALKIQPNVTFFHLTKGEILELKGNFKGAMREKWIAFFLGASDVLLLNGLGKWCLENKKYNMAEKVFKRTINAYPKSPVGYINLAQVYYLQGKEREAKELYLKGMSIGGTPIPQFEELLKISKTP